VRPKRDRDEPVLITEAEPSLDDQYNARRKKYAAMMATRAVCLVLAAVFHRIPVLMALFAVGALVLPWMAVLMANDRPPKKAAKVNRLHRGQHDDRALPAPPDHSRIIEGG
jgi:hypothetical protein